MIVGPASLPQRRAKGDQAVVPHAVTSGRDTISRERVLDYCRRYNFTVIASLAPNQCGRQPRVSNPALQTVLRDQKLQTENV